MNKLANELFVQARVECFRLGVRPATTIAYDELDKFVELIVKECAGIATDLSKLYDRKDVGFDVGYSMGTARAAEHIRLHFGVEE